MSARSKSETTLAKPHERGATVVTQGEGPTLLSLDSTILGDVRVGIRVRLGEVTMSIAELMALKGGAVVKLDRMMSDFVDLQLNDAVVARGEIVAVDDHFGVRIVEIGERS